MNAPEPSSQHLGTVELRIPGKPEWVAVARLAVAAVANRLPFSVEEIEDIKLAIAEACALCITQAGGAEAIDIICDAGTSELRVKVRDQRYRGRDETAKRPSIKAVESPGLGVFLIGALMDDLDVNADTNLGTDIAMTKRAGA